MKMKGITPIISIVLLLLITIVVIGLAAVYFTDTQTGAQEQTNSAIANLRTQLIVPFSFENQIGTNFHIRNKGDTAIEAGTLTVYADNEPVDAQILEPIQPGTVGTITVPPEVIANNNKLRIVGTVYEQTISIDKGEIIGEW